MENKNLKQNLIKLLAISAIVVTFLVAKNVQATEYKGDINTNVSYISHVSNIGWQNAVTNGKIAGTTGQNKAMEAIQIDVDDRASYSIEYTALSEGKGWSNTCKDGETAGTTGESRALLNLCVALKDKTTGGDANYDVFYRVHVSNEGWLGWVKNGSGANYTNNKIEAVQIQIRPKGQVSEDQGNINTNVSYITHVSNIGWQNAVTNGKIAGTTGQNKAMEAIQIDVDDRASYSIEYTALSEGKGWSNTCKDGETAGTTGESRALLNLCVALKDKTTGGDANYDVFYRVHVSNEGWLGWVKNGNCANYTKNKIEAVQIQIRPKEQVSIELNAKRQRIVDEAFIHLGQPYVYGANGPDSFDCSGLTQYVYQKVLEKDITRTTSTQINQGISVSQNNLLPGDLIFTNAYHVGIYIGDNKMIHAPNPRDGVKISTIQSFYAARRIIY